MGLGTPTVLLGPPGVPVGSREGGMVVSGDPLGLRVTWVGDGVKVVCKRDRVGAGLGLSPPGDTVGKGGVMEGETSPLPVEVGGSVPKGAPVNRAEGEG